MRPFGFTDSALSRSEERKKDRAEPAKVAVVAAAHDRVHGIHDQRGCLQDPEVEEVVEFRDGEVLDLPGEPVVIQSPGHTPGE